MGHPLVITCKHTHTLQHTERVLEEEDLVMGGVFQSSRAPRSPVPHAVTENTDFCFVIF